MVLLKSTRLVHIVILDEFRPIVVNVRSRSDRDDMTTIEVDMFSMLFLAVDMSLLITCTHPYFFFRYSLITHSLSACTCCAHVLVGTYVRTE